MLNEFFNKLEHAENSSLDLRFRWRGAQAPDPNIAIVGVTKPYLSAAEVPEQELKRSEALRAMGEKDFPWRRVVWIEVLDRLFASGARVVVFDIVFGRQTEEDPAFAAILQKYRGKVVLAMTVDAKEDSGQLQLRYPHPGLLGETPKEWIACAAVHKETADDETIRRIDHFTSELREYGLDDPSNEIPGLAAFAVEKFTGKPVTAGQRRLIRYQGPRETYDYLPVHELLDDGLFKSSKFRGGEVFRDKIVFIGATYELAHDDKATPFGVMAGVEVHAQAAADLLTGARLHEVGARTGWWITLVSMISAVGTIGFFRRAWVQAVAVISLLLGYVLLAYIAFVARDAVLPMMAPIVAIAATGLFGFTLSFAVEQREKAQTRKVLDRSVNKRIAKVMMQNEEFEHARRGERRAVAILFSDIRSFTTWSERAEPEHLVGQLNEYFERMVELIEREGSLGNAQKFIGDAILAAWGDTPENQFGDAEDARRAVTVALQMRSALTDLNSLWGSRADRIQISVGMGVNLGEVVVGEVGHPERREYTVLGDGVNFAARLESATKQFHTDCLVGEQVEALTRDHFVFRHVDYLKVKGKTKPVNVYTLISDRSVPPPPWLDAYHHARETYVQRDFAKAAEQFRAVKAQIGGEDFLCDMYAERCELYAKEPPAQDWDGSFTMTEK